MTRVIIDTSVIIKWFHGDGETELAAARALLDAHVRGQVDAHVLDLALYEVGNVLVRSLRWPANEAADQLDDVLAVFGTPLVPSPEWLRAAAELAAAHDLTFYDSAWAAAARGLGVPLVSADRKLLASGLAESATAAVERLGLSLSSGPTTGRS